MPTLRIEPDGPRVEIPEGSAPLVLDVLEAAGYVVPYNCRAGRCGADPVRVVDGDLFLSPPEGIECRTLEDLARDGQPDCRMACQARVLGDVTVDITPLGLSKAA
ncbi:MAG: (2Fe-2S)-binding protein [Myxococcales bacterium]|nr:(2Fe-2S)-binding protein [Myxococcales bacterium]